MSRSDPLLMLADIAQVVSERPELDPILVQALYRHFLTTQRRDPTIQQSLAYIDRVTSSIDEDTLWRTLGLGPPRMGAPRAPTDPRRDRLKGTSSTPPTDATVPGEIWVGALPAAERAAFEAALREGRERVQGEREAQDASSREEFEHAVRTLPGGDRIPDLVRPITEGRPATGAEWVLLRELQEVAEREQRRQAVDQVRTAARPGVRPEDDALRPWGPQPPGQGQGEAERTRVPGRPGRPGWTVDTFREHWSEAVAATPQPLTFASVAANFRQLNVGPGTSHLGIDSEHLSDLHRKHGAPAFE